MPTSLVENIVEPMKNWPFYSGSKRWSFSVQDIMCMNSWVASCRLSHMNVYVLIYRQETESSRRSWVWWLTCIFGKRQKMYHPDTLGSSNKVATAWSRPRGQMRTALNLLLEGWVPAHSWKVQNPIWWDMQSVHSESNSWTCYSEHTTLCLMFLRDLLAIS